ncbi:hypothetical protein HY793_01750 [Candidatus Desantisbacteria bacterium]|nr:hypothetical protein [Candidatus Desantisbacteria bacterium]
MFRESSESDFPIQDSTSYSGVGVTSCDPNDKAGHAGVGEKHWVLPDRSFPYIIYFENLGTATAAAQEIKITDQLDANLDWTSLEFKVVISILLPFV